MLQVQADRADVSEARADASEARAAEIVRRRLRIDELEKPVDLYRELIMLQRAQGVLEDEQVANLEIALTTSRRIGAALLVAQT